LKAVNLGSDTDTVAAIAGSLAGALYKMEAIPSEWLDELKRTDYIEELCRCAFEAWY
jgi:ADP-ribosylglycohydrolase